MSDEDLIPCDDELNRLKEFLLNQKRDRYEREIREVEWREKWLASRINNASVPTYPKPNSSNCLWCATPLLGRAVTLCDACEESRQKEKKDAYEAPETWYEPD